MSSIVIKLGSLVVKTLSKPIAVGVFLLQSLIIEKADSSPFRTVSRLKPGSTRGSVVSASASRKVYTDGICDSGLDFSKIARHSRNKLLGKLQKLKPRSTSPKLLRS